MKNEQTQTPWIFEPSDEALKATQCNNDGAATNEEERIKRVKHFRFFGLWSLLYAALYTFCLYKNPAGITYPFFIGGTLFYFFLSLRRLGITAKKDSAFYVISLMLLGISTFCTDNANIHFMNKLGIFLLFFSLMIHSFYADKDWEFLKYLQAIFQTVFGSVITIGRPFSDFFLFIRSGKKGAGNEEESGKGKYVLLGLAISLPLAFYVLLLLASADVVFRKLMFNIKLPDNMAGIFFCFMFALLASYCVITYLVKKEINSSVPKKHTLEPLTAITFTSVLSVIYIIFSGVQIIYLFVGNMALPEGYTYAEYARQGFFQLLFVCLINLALVLICLGYFKEHKVLKLMLAVISLCTYVMIASSTLRMIMYIKYYYLTFLRIFVLWSLFVIFLLITGVLIHIVKKDFPLFRYSMAAVTILYIGLSFSRPDYWIAKCNTSYMTGTESGFFENENGYSDIRYLERLSADAAPVIIALAKQDIYKGFGEEEDIWFNDYLRRRTNEAEDMTLRSYNLSKAALLLQSKKVQ